MWIGDFEISILIVCDINMIFLFEIWGLILNFCEFVWCICFNVLLDKVLFFVFFFLWVVCDYLFIFLFFLKFWFIILLGWFFSIDSIV